MKKSNSKDHLFSNQANEPFNHLSSAAEILGEMKNPFAKFNCSLIFLTSEYLVFRRLDLFTRNEKFPPQILSHREGNGGLVFWRLGFLKYKI